MSATNERCQRHREEIPHHSPDTETELILLMPSCWTLNLQNRFKYTHTEGGGGREGGRKKNGERGRERKREETPLA